MIWVAYATADQQYYVDVAFLPDMTVQDAIQQSGIENLPEPLVYGIFNEKVSLDTVLKDGDRVEIYRTLTINPKDIRRVREKNNPYKKRTPR